MTKKKHIKRSVDLIGKFIKEQDRLQTLPPLNDVERATFEHSVDIEHLYFSSKVEGTHLTKQQIDNAIHGPEI